MSARCPSSVADFHLPSPDAPLAGDVAKSRKSVAQGRDDGQGPEKQYEQQQVRNRGVEMGLVHKSLSGRRTGRLVGHRSASKKQSVRAKKVAQHTEEMPNQTKRNGSPDAAYKTPETDGASPQPERLGGSQLRPEIEAWLDRVIAGHP
jgi:hypothetical protein